MTIREKNFLPNINAVSHNTSIQSQSGSKDKEEILAKTSKTENETGTIWCYHGNIFKAHCNDPNLARRIASWEGCEASSIYHYPDGHREMDVMFPSKLYNRVAKLLGLPPRDKNPKRVAQGKRMSVFNKKHRFSRNTTSEKLAINSFYEP